MIVHTPEVSKCDNEICVSARVETNSPQTNLPERLWFKFLLITKPYLNEFSDGFAASLLFLAMYLEEPFQVRGPISSRLAYGLNEWGKVFHVWLPNELKLVDLDFLDLQQHSPLGQRGVVCTAFSGGGNSLHTLWSHLHQNQPIQAVQVTHALFIHGFDIRLHNLQKYQALSLRYSGELNNLGIILLNIRTNAYLFYKFRVKWETFHAGPLIGTALALGNLISRFYIPSSNDYLGLAGMVDGTSPLTDHLLSTEATEIVHFGSAFIRSQKIKIISDWSVAQRILHICIDTDRTTDANNCGRCIKCLANMVRLEIYGVLPKYKTFQHKFSIWDIFRMAIIVDVYLSLNYSLFMLALKAHRFDLAIPLFLVLLWNTLRKILINIPFQYLNKILPRETRYKLRRRLFQRQEEYQPETNSTTK